MPSSGEKLVPPNDLKVGQRHNTQSTGKTGANSDEFFYLVQSRSQNRHQEAVVDVTQQLGADGGMSDLGNGATEVQGVQEVDQSWNLSTQNTR